MSQRVEETMRFVEARPKPDQFPRRLIVAGAALAS
jgi:hypothetical protein